MPLGGLGFFFSFNGRVGVLDFYCSHEVLNEFPTYSSQVPNVFPISPPHFIPYPFALSFGLVTFISKPK